MSSGSLSFGNAGWLEPVLLLLALGVGAALLGYRRQRADRRLRWALALKIASLTLLALALLEPSWSTPQARPGANFFLVLADNSRSLQLSDRGDGQNRGQRLRGLLTGEPLPSWLTSLGETFQLRRYLFDARLRRVPDFESLAFDGEASHLGVALRTLAERYRGAPLAGILLLTDGNATDLDQRPADISGLPPIYPVVIGSGRGPVRRRAPAPHRHPDRLRGRSGHHRGPAGHGRASRAARWRSSCTTTAIACSRFSGSRSRATTRPPAPAFACDRIARACAPTGSPSRAATGRPPPPTTAGWCSSNGRPAPSGFSTSAGRANWEYKFLRRAIEKREADRACGAPAGGPARAQDGLQLPPRANPPTRSIAASGTRARRPNGTTNRCWSGWAPATPRSCARGSRACPRSCSVTTR